ncbi:MAG: hypothetical protein K2X81_26190 [Candidatus Obscuribacterales bacterium]|nr:hypothetical protein [Candidatus Obscuribacterales bacterium]
MNEFALGLLAVAALIKTATIVLATIPTWRKPWLAVSFVAITVLTFNKFLLIWLFFTPLLSIWVIYILKNKRWRLIYISFALVDLFTSILLFNALKHLSANSI